MGVQIRAQINRDRKSQAKVLVLQKEITTRLELKVQERTEALVKANKEITLRNDELNKQQEAIISINNHLESLVVMRTAEITKQNDSLRNYAYFNAHKVRGPLARILGLIYLTKIDPIKSLEDFNILIHQLDTCANELDNTIREINEILSEDDEESPDQ
jgi:signal transduction histidine kinase